MSRKGKKYLEVVKKVDKNKMYSSKEALELLKELKTAKFVESVEVSLKLGVDSRHADQQVRGTVVLPNGTGKKIKILALTSAKEEEAKNAGADYVGSDEYVEKIKKGWLDFDMIIATPDMMPKLGRLGKVLGPKGLMPNPKSGTVTPQIGQAVEEFKKGKLAFKVDKFNMINVGIGKVDFENEKIKENFDTLLKKIIELKPKESKGQYLRRVSVALTMGPGVKIDPLLLQKDLEVK
ncbi:MAG: 50S ribosomal protein L1 [Fusobacteriia bacterium 4572_132]|nr:MAG: 50S ribosomal protein L1 [Fusobacteriia bacterium 4572_132]